jgi:hypothetical protein
MPAAADNSTCYVSPVCASAQEEARLTLTSVSLGLTLDRASSGGSIWSSSDAGRTRATAGGRGDVGDVDSSAAAATPHALVVLVVCGQQLVHEAHLMASRGPHLR